MGQSTQLLRVDVWLRTPRRGHAVSSQRRRQRGLNDAGGPWPEGRCVAKMNRYIMSRPKVTSDALAEHQFPKLTCESWAEKQRGPAQPPPYRLARLPRTKPSANELR